MEDELTVVHKELKSLKAKLKELPILRVNLKDMLDEAGVSEVIVNRLKDEVRSLKTEISQLKVHSPEEVPASATVSEELESLKKQYAELEESYLDLKLQE